MPGPEDAGPSTQPQPTYESLQRPPFRPSELSASSPTFISQPGIADIPAFSHAVHFTLNNFFAAIKELTLHPERNSSLILRADPLAPRDPTDDEEIIEAGLDRREEVRVKLLPKQVKRDGKLDQRVSFYEDQAGRGVVVMVPEVKDVGDVPFYHPPVKKLAFLFEPFESDEHGNGDEDDEGGGAGQMDDKPDEQVAKLGDAETTLPMRGTVTIAYLPFPTTESPTGTIAQTTASSSTARNAPSASSPFFGARPIRSPRKRSPLASSTEDAAPPKPPAVIFNADGTAAQQADHKSRPLSAEEVAKRTVRTCRLLLERVYKHAYGDLVGYQKRVLHDVVVNRESFQDLYLVLKDRHRHLDSRVTNPRSLRVEDVKRHVWKDVAIATFLMLLWKEMYPAVERSASLGDEEIREWDTWGRPSGGFVDLGCGNGLLVHILTSEGYQGKGYELRARKTWPNYPPRTRAALVEQSISFPEWFPDNPDQWEQGEWDGRADCPIRDGCFVIGNHADEITPWIPLLSLIPTQPVPYLSLPCCFHTLDDSWNALTFVPPPHAHMPEGGFEKGLEEGQSRYKAYLVWLGWMGLMCGWEWEKEGLRIPSTKGWGIVARKRWTTSVEELRACREWALEQVQGVRDRGAFKVREREGKDNH